MLGLVGDRDGRLQIAPLLSAAGDEKRGSDFYVIGEVGSRTVVVVGDVVGKGKDAAPFADEVRERPGSRTARTRPGYSSCSTEICALKNALTAT
jgi:hypothetical protein